MPKLSLKTWISIATAVLVLLIVVLARKELFHAWQLLTQVNLWVLALLIPILLLDYYASGEMFFSYLRAKRRLRKMPHFIQIRTTLEMNFVNHVLPSGGLSGISYVTWRLGNLGVSSSRALMSQVVKVVMGIVGFLLLLFVAVIMVTVDGSVNRVIILISSVITGIMLAALVITLFVITNKKRVRVTSRVVVKYVNKVVGFVSLGRKKKLLDLAKTEAFMDDMHEDYLELKGDVRVLKWPLIWSIIFNVLEVVVFYIVFLALGVTVNPALILIAYGVALLAGFAVITPGGAGAYEALMIGFLTISGVGGDIAIAGIILARSIILLSILGLGWGFYQQALGRGKSYGKDPA